MKFTKVFAFMALAGLAGSAFATNGDNLIDLGVQSRALGGTGTAAFFGSENALTNPALLGKMQRTEFAIRGRFFMPDVKATTDVAGMTGSATSDGFDQLLLAIDDIEVTIFVHAGDLAGEQPGFSIGKLAQALSYGARLLQVRGTYNDAARLTEEMSDRHGFYLAGDYAFRVEGQKSQPSRSSNSSTGRRQRLSSCPWVAGRTWRRSGKAFKEFFELGLIARLPRMVGVQAEGCAPILTAFQQGLEQPAAVEKPFTVCTAVAAGDPIDGLKALSALRESGGCGVIVSDAEILDAQQQLAHLGPVPTALQANACSWWTTSSPPGRRSMPAPRRSAKPVPRPSASSPWRAWSDSDIF